MIITLLAVVACNTKENPVSEKITSMPGNVNTAVPFPVYPGCSAPATTFKRMYVLDGNSGQTLQNALLSKSVQPGDHIIVKGPQGSFSLSKYSNPELVTTNDWIKVESQNAVFSNFDIRDVSKFLILNAKVTRSSGNLANIAGANNIVIADSEFYGAADSSSWDAAAWIAAPSGINSDNSTCVSYLRNKLTNLRFGMSIFTRGQTSDVTSLRALAYKNELRNLSGDFIRPNGSNITIQENKAYDGYVSAADGDSNHDDFIQGFAYPLGIRYSNVKIIGNYFLQTTDSTRPLQSDYQGISVFDGNFTDYVIRGNTILAGAYHGIAMYWGENGLIENNTVLSIYPGFGRKLWISVPKSKGGDPSVNVVVRNNISNQVVANTDNPDVSYANNAVILPADAANHFEAMDVLNSDYDLRLLANSIWYDKNVGADQE